MFFKDMKGVIVLVVFAVAAAFGFNYLSPNGIALVGQWDADRGTISAKTKSKPVDTGIEVISPEIVHHMIETGQRILVDVRSRQEYLQGHIPSALSFPIEMFDENVALMMARLKPDDPLLIYCSSAECQLSHTFAAYIAPMGFTDVKVFSGGFRQWQEEGYEVVSDEG